LTTLIVVQCVLILAVSLVGGWIPLRLGSSHRSMQVALSFVAGTMFGLAMLDLLPEAIHAGSVSGMSVSTIALWVVGGFLAIFLLERFVCFHHHELPDEASGCGHQPHSLSWVAAGFGLSLHGLMAGVALAASILLGSGGHVAIPGLAMLLAIVLHKPFDAMSLIALMTVAGRSRRARMLANGLFSLVTPLGVVIGIWLGGNSEAPPHWLGPALGFAVGMFLCVSLSDLLPELQFHRHDRVLLSLALVAGLGVAWLAGQFHDHGSSHEHGAPTSSQVHPHDHGSEPVGD
jgi:zinc and cadmium transporter